MEFRELSKDEYLALESHFQKIIRDEECDLEMLMDEIYDITKASNLSIDEKLAAIAKTTDKITEHRVLVNLAKRLLEGE
jgi:hypothetical protein